MTIDREIEDVMTSAIRLAMRYKALTGKPLGITGEVAEFRAAQLLDLTLVDARTPGYDAIGPIPCKKRIQIKGRCLSALKQSGHRLGGIKFDYEWDCVLMVLMNDAFEVFEIWEADRAVIEVALMLPGSISRNKRGALSVSKFKQIGTLVWLQAIHD